MNIGELYFRIGNIELATFWLETSLDNAVKTKNFHSVLRGMVLLANIYQLDPTKVFINFYYFYLFPIERIC